MPIVAVDDTDSRERGMCTTYVGVRIAERLERAGGRVTRRLLVRLNPAVKHKTRGNAAVAVWAEEVGADEAFRVAEETVREFAAAGDPLTSPGLVVAGGVSGDVPDDVATFARRALRERLSLGEAVAIADRHGFTHAGFGSGGADGETTPGRGRIGALAAVGAWAAFEEWTYEQIAYREFDRCGTPRMVDTESVFAAATRGYPTVWDTIDRAEAETVCVPNAPGPILYGIRGDHPDAVGRVTEMIASESVERDRCFVTNQGTDSHLRTGTLGSLQDGTAYRVDGIVIEPPETREGGHVFLTLGRAGDGDSGGDTADGVETAVDVTADCVAFEPTKRFRDRVRGLRVGDRLTVCGEYTDGTIKLEKFAIRELCRTERVTPTCEGCGRRMKSAGRGQGYRCRDCGTSAPGKVRRRIDRELDNGWYEVPPCARRHIAKPLVRGGFDAPTHPER